MMPYYEIDLIPRLCIALAHWMGCLVYLRLLPPRWDKIGRAAVYAAALAVFSVYLVATDGHNGVVFNLFYCGAVGLMLLFFLAASGADVFQCGYFCARAFILAGFASSLIWQLYVYFAPDSELLQTFWGLCAFVIVGYILVFGLATLLEQSSRAMEAINFEVTPRTFGIVTVLAAGVYMLSSISYSSFETPFTATGRMEIYTMRTIAYFGGVALLFAYQVQLCDLMAQREADALRNMLQIQYESYKMRQESVDLVNRKYHDLKHQIALLRAETGQERNQVLDDLERDIRAYEAQNDVGNKVLNTILASQVTACQARGIQTTCVVDGAALDFMNAMDLSNLFGNAFDNAIEAVDGLSDPQKRLIELSVARQKGFVAIRFENCFEGKLNFRNGLPVTTKSDDRFHGFGIKSIQATAQKYGGSATVSARDGRFALRVLIPMPDANGA